MDSSRRKQFFRAGWLQLVAIFAGALFAFGANATPLFDVTSAVTATDPTQLGRISRNGVPSDWSTAKAFPGVINATTSYHYEAFTVNVQQATFIQIMMDSLSANTFASVYLGAYVPASGLGLNYLGDAGSSGNFFGAIDTGTSFVTDPIFFQVQVPAFSDIVIVVNETSGAAGLGLLQPFTLLVEGFIDSEFTDIPVPEPSTLGLGLAALLAFAFVRRKSLLAKIR